MGESDGVRDSIDERWMRRNERKWEGWSVDYIVRKIKLDNNSGWDRREKPERYRKKCESKKKKRMITVEYENVR